MFAIENEATELMKLTFIVHLQRHSRESRYIMIYKWKLFAEHFILIVKLNIFFPYMKK